MSFIFQPDPAIGVNLRLDPTGDLAVSPSGNLDLIGNVVPVQNLWQSTILRLCTSLGTYILGPPGYVNLYGTKLRRFIDQPMTPLQQQQIQNEINTTVLSDPRIKKITNLTVTANPSGYNVKLSFSTQSGQNVGGVFTVAG